MKIDFEFDTPNGVFRDALNLPDDHAFTEEEVQAMKQGRVDNWLVIVNAPPIEEAVAEDFIEVNGVQYAKVV
jgi:hypothetical protein